MKCIFVGDLEDDAGFVAEVLQEKGIELIEAGVYDQIEKTINPVIEAQAEIVVYDLLVLSDQPDELVDIINRIQQSRNGAKIIFLAAGKGTNTPVIDKGRICKFRIGVDLWCEENKVRKMPYELL